MYIGCSYKVVMTLYTYRVPKVRRVLVIVLPLSIEVLLLFLIILLLPPSLFFLLLFVLIFLTLFISVRASTKEVFFFEPLLCLLCSFLLSFEYFLLLFKEFIQEIPIISLIRIILLAVARSMVRVLTLSFLMITATTAPLIGILIGKRITLSSRVITLSVIQTCRVVLLLFLLIAQNIVSSSNLLEFVRGLALVFVRVILLSQLVEASLDVFLRGRGRHPQYLVVVFVHIEVGRLH
jgi:hypothetical protein